MPEVRLRAYYFSRTLGRRAEGSRALSRGRGTCGEAQAMRLRGGHRYLCCSCHPSVGRRVCLSAGLSTRGELSLSPPLLRVRHGADPPHPFPGAPPGEDRAPAPRERRAGSRAGLALGPVSRAPDLPGDPAAPLTGRRPPTDSSGDGAAREPNGRGGRAGGCRARWPRPGKPLSRSDCRLWGCGLGNPSRATQTSGMLRVSSDGNHKLPKPVVVPLKSFN